MRRFLFILLLFVGLVYAHAQVPSCSLRDTDGRVANITSIVGQGHPVILSFWNTRCKPCIREIKAIDEVYPDWQDETGVELVLVSEDTAHDQQRVKPFVDGNGWTFRCLLDGNGELKRMLSVTGEPHVFIFDAAGRMVYNHAGYTDGSEQELLRIIRSL